MMNGILARKIIFGCVLLRTSRQIRYSNRINGILVPRRVVVTYVSSMHTYVHT